MVIPFSIAVGGVIILTTYIVNKNLLLLICVQFRFILFPVCHASQIGFLKRSSLYVVSICLAVCNICLTSYLQSGIGSS